jgi:diaminohydroxyphosphoribosylaminopyrimidine deaminase/5-amino-6-(5-phosphoribosylamino)uracil reductase
VLAALHEREVRHVWLEGGPRLAAAFVAAGYVDEVLAYLAPALLGSGVAAVADLGISSIAGTMRLDVAEVDVLPGGDVRIVGTFAPTERGAPATGQGAPATEQGAPPTEQDAPPTDRERG